MTLEWPENYFHFFEQLKKDAAVNLQTCVAQLEETNKLGIVFALGRHHSPKWLLVFAMKRRRKVWMYAYVSTDFNVRRGSIIRNDVRLDLACGVGRHA